MAKTTGAAGRGRAANRASRGETRVAVSRQSANESPARRAFLGVAAEAIRTQNWLNPSPKRDDHRVVFGESEYHARVTSTARKGARRFLASLTWSRPADRPGGRGLSVIYQQHFDTLDKARNAIIEAMGREALATIK